MSDKFDYSYNALSEEERREAEALRREYSPQEKKSDALSKLRALDKKVRLPAEITAYLLGVIGFLLFGIGMCMCLDAISGGVTAGAIIGVAGILVASLNYKIYKVILKARKKKYSEEILKISEQLLKDKN